MKRTERGWRGHYCLANRCLFSRNTLLERGEVRVVISTIGNKLNTNPIGPHIDMIGSDRYYETKVFQAECTEGGYWDANVMREFQIESPAAISKPCADQEANDMHEAVVSEIENKLAYGIKL